MAAARLSALAAAALAVGLAASSPPVRGSGLVSLLGWLGAAALVVGLLVGYRPAIVASAVAFVIRLTVTVSFGVELIPPLWAQALLLVLMVEFAGGSFTLRTRPVDIPHHLSQSVATAVLVSLVVAAMSALVESARADGTLVRVAGLAALVIAGGWVVRAWRRSGLEG